MKLINWIKENKILATIIGTVIADIISSIVLSLINKINLWNATLLIWREVYSFFENIMLFKVSVWIIIVILLTIVSIKVIVKRIINKESDIINKPKYKEYKEDTYGGRKYSWDYIEYGNNIRIDKFKPICPKCSGNLIEKKQIGNTYYGREKLFCPNCQVIACDIPYVEDLHEAEVFIENKIRKILKEN